MPCIFLRTILTGFSPSCPSRDFKFGSSRSSFGKWVPINFEILSPPGGSVRFMSSALDRLMPY